MFGTLINISYFNIKRFRPLSSIEAMSRKKQQNVLHYKSKTPTKENKVRILFHLLRQLELYQSNLIHIINYKAFIEHLKEAYSPTALCNIILRVSVITFLFLLLLLILLCRI
jgi:hypothetical protein